MHDFHIADMRLFVKAVEMGGLTQAAQALRIPKASASRQLQRLEGKVGHLLLHRGSVRFALTEEGNMFLASAENVISKLDQAVRDLTGKDEVVSGRLRIAVPQFFGRDLLAPHLPRFMASFPALEISMETGGNEVDLFRDQADLAVRIGRAGGEDLVARRLRLDALVLCASPRYLNRRPAIAAPKDLGGHAFLTTTLEGRPREMTIPIADRLHVVESTGVMRCNDPEMLLRMAAASQGIALVPLRLALVEIESQVLVRVLPELPLLPHEINIAYVPGRRNVPKIKLFVDYILDAVRPMSSVSPELQRATAP